MNIGQKLIVLPVKNGNSENHITGSAKLLTFRLSRSLAGYWKFRSKQIMRPNFTPKSVSNVDMSGLIVLRTSWASLNKLNFR